MLLPSLNVNDVEIAAVLAAVILPLLSIVRTGTATALPTLPAVTPLFASVTANVASPEPSILTLPEASPLRPKSLAVLQASAVPALPLTLPVTSPVTEPTKSAVTVSNETLLVVATA